MTMCSSAATSPISSTASSSRRRYEAGNAIAGRFIMLRYSSPHASRRRCCLCSRFHSLPTNVSGEPPRFRLQLVCSSSQCRHLFGQNSSTDTSPLYNSSSISTMTSAWPHLASSVTRCSQQDGPTRSPRALSISYSQLMSLSYFSGHPGRSEWTLRCAIAGCPLPSSARCC